MLDRLFIRTERRGAGRGRGRGRGGRVGLVLGLGFGFGFGFGGVARADSGVLKVAAAADLALAFREVGAAFEKETGTKVIFSFGSTGLLEKQIEQGAPFDVFAAANISFADDAIRAGACVAGSRSLYARGRIVVWTRKGQKPPQVAGLVDRRFSRIAIAHPEHAPYGRAAQEAFVKAGVAAELKPRLVYGENVQQALQFAQTGNADAAVIALSLAVVSDGDYTLIDESQHRPIEQAMVACGRDATRLAAAAAFTGFVSSPAGRAIMRRYGFLLPGEARAQNP